MAEKPVEYTTEQLLIELGRAVMGLGTKLDTLGQKLDGIQAALSEERPEPRLDTQPLLERLDSIHQALSAERPPAEQQAPPPQDLQPLLEKLDSIHQALSAGTPSPEGGGSAMDVQPLLEKLDSIHGAITSDRRDPGEYATDLTPVLEKLEELRTAVAGIDPVEGMKPLIEEVTASVGSIPGTLLEGMGKEFEPVREKLDSIQKAAEDRAFVASITDSVGASGEALVTAVKEIPVKLQEMGVEFTGSMDRLTEKTEEVLGKADASLERAGETLAEVKEELQKGLKLNTDMTGQMVELTSRFADKAREDRVTELNSRAVSHFSRGEYTEAGELFNEALELAPGNPELLCNSAHVLAAGGDLKAAEERFRKALAESPELEPAISGLGMIMVKTDRPDETIEFLKSTILSGDPSVKTTIAYTRALAALEKHDEAVELLETALKSAPDNPEIVEELEKYGHRSGE